MIGSATVSKSAKEILTIASRTSNIRVVCDPDSPTDGSRVCGSLSILLGSCGTGSSKEEPTASQKPSEPRLAPWHTLA